MAKKIAACLTFDFDAISLWLGGFHAKSLSAISRGEFGRVGALRLLAMLREWKIPSTWFVPGHSAETYPEIARQIAAEGHEIGNHGYFHSHPKSPEDEERILIRGNDVLERVTGKRPLGFRSPGAGLSFNMVSLLLKHGFLYDSSLMGDDFTPHYMRVGDQAPDDAPYQFGQAGRRGRDSVHLGPRRFSRVRVRDQPRRHPAGTVVAVGGLRNLGGRLRLSIRSGRRGRVHADDASAGDRTRPSTADAGKAPRAHS